MEQMKCKTCTSCVWVFSLFPNFLYCKLEAESYQQATQSSSWRSLNPSVRAILLHYLFPDKPRSAQKCNFATEIYVIQVSSLPDERLSAEERGLQRP